MAPFEKKHFDKAFQNVKRKSHVIEGIPARSGCGRKYGYQGLVQVFSNVILCCSFKKYVSHECIYRMLTGLRSNLLACSVNLGVSS